MNYHQQKTLEVLKQGGVIGYPTDTTFGIGCDITNEAAIHRIQELKQRDLGKAMSIACSDMEMAYSYADFHGLPQKFLDDIFPGPVTLILPKTELVSEIVTAGSKKVGVRIPYRQDILAIIKALGHPIITTSANLSGGTDPVSSDEIELEVDFVYPGECSIKKPSTVIDIETKKIVREGVRSDYYKELLSGLLDHK